MMRSKRVGIGLAAVLAIAAAAAPGAAQPQAAGLCADPAAFCGAMIAPECLQRIGAGAVANGSACEGQFQAYRGCLASAVGACDAPAEGPPQPTAASVERERLAQDMLEQVKDSGDPRRLALVAQRFPDTFAGELAALMAEELRSAAAAPANSAPQADQSAAPAANAATLDAAPQPAFPAAPDIRTAQTELKRLGYYAAEIDGDWGPASRRALAAFQRAYGRPDSAGALSPDTLTALAAATPKPRPVTPQSTAAGSSATSQPAFKDFFQERRGWIGVLAQTVTEPLAADIGLLRAEGKPRGALIVGVAPGGPAAAAGLTAGHIITAVNGAAIKAVSDLPDTLGQFTVGDRVAIHVMRAGETRREEIILAPAPKNASAPRALSFGMALVALTARDRAEFAIDGDVVGALVAAVAPNSAAAAAGVRAGDVIDRIETQEVLDHHTAMGDFAELKARGKASARFQLMRSGGRFVATLVLND